MDASTRVALAGVLVSFVIGFATFLLQRRAGQQQRDLGLIDQLQEERSHALQRAREMDTDLDSLREKYNEALDRIDHLLDANREQARKLKSLEGR